MALWDLCVLAYLLWRWGCVVSEWKVFLLSAGSLEADGLAGRAPGQQGWHSKPETIHQSLHTCIILQLTLICLYRLMLIVMVHLVPVALALSVQWLVIVPERNSQTGLSARH